jgi:hypothetical protein
MSHPSIQVDHRNARRAGLPVLRRVDYAEESRGKMSWKQFLQVWGFAPKNEIIEECINSAPTAGPGDDGSGWVESTRPAAPVKGSRSGAEFQQPDDLVYQRHVRRTPPPANERDQWQETAPGVWSKKGG